MGLDPMPEKRKILRGTRDEHRDSREVDDLMLMVDRWVEEEQGFGNNRWSRIFWRVVADVAAILTVLVLATSIPAVAIWFTDATTASEFLREFFITFVILLIFFGIGRYAFWFKR